MDGNQHKVGLAGDCRRYLDRSESCLLITIQRDDYGVVVAKVVKERWPKRNRRYFSIPYENLLLVAVDHPKQNVAARREGLTRSVVDITVREERFGCEDPLRAAI